jgi:histidine kinase-like protein
MNTQMRGSDASSEHPLAPVARSLAEQAFRQRDIPAVRRAAATFAARAGLGAAKLSDFVQAVSEAAGCAVAQGPCTARLRLWRMGSRAFCEITADGMLQADGPSGRLRPVDETEALRRWLLHRLCDHVSVRTGPHGVTVILSMTVA